VFDRRVLAGDEGLAEGKWVLHDLQDLLFTRVGDVHQEVWWSMAGGDGLRRPCRVARSPSEGPANTDHQGMHEHHKSVEMLSPCLIWSETGRRVVLDGGVDVGFLPAAMAAGVLRAGATEGGGEVVEELQGDVEKLGVEAIGVEEGQREVSHGKQKATAGGDRRQSSGSRCGALGNQLGGRRASGGREEST
jgi:hypothetical protein